MRSRKLSLKKETLVELSATDLGSVVGGAISGVTCPACPISGIVVCLPTDRCPTQDACFTTHGCG